MRRAIAWNIGSRCRSGRARRLAACIERDGGDGQGAVAQQGRHRQSTAPCWGFLFSPAIGEPRPKSDGAEPREPSSREHNSQMGRSINARGAEMFLGASRRQELHSHFQAASQPDAETRVSWPALPRDDARPRNRSHNRRLRRWICAGIWCSGTYLLSASSILSSSSRRNVAPPLFLTL
jgi:hypothetical protein